MAKLSKLFSYRSLFLPVLIFLAMSANAVSAQTVAEKTRNNPYAPSPLGKTKPADPPLSRTGGGSEVAFITRSESTSAPDKRIATVNVPEAGPKPSLPTESYKIGGNDVLYIKLKNVDSHSGYYTVRPDGTIDFPLAGEMVVVAGKSTEEVESMLKARIKLFADPRPEVRIRDYASHKVSVFGSVANAGERSLQREAVPFFVIKAASMVLPEATAAKITPPGQESVTYDLSAPELENYLIFPGTVIEFLSVKATYYVTGKNVVTGERSLTPGMTLMQASIAAIKKGGEPKKGVIRRRNNTGILSILEFDLKAVKSGRIADPALISGDIIEITN